METLRTEHLSKYYGEKENRVIALDDVSFSVDPGEFVAIVGSSGSGKSTLLHLLGGVDVPSEGRVIVDGNDISHMKEAPLAIYRRRQIGLIYQFYNLIPILNVEENIMLPLLLDGRKPDRAYFRELVETLGLSDRLSHLPNQLSGGQQQRVSIARALVGMPSVILADEPTGALDSKTGREVLNILQGLNQQGNTVVLITHDNSIAATAKRIIRLEDGRVVYDGPSDDPKAFVRGGMAAGETGCAPA